MSKLIKQAFTLIELLVVIAIIGILSGLIVVAMGGVTQKANIAKAQVFSNSLRNSLMLNLVAEWKFDELTTAIEGTSIQDSWGGVNNGRLDTYVTTVDSVDKLKSGSDCVSGKCLSFDGIDDYVDCGNGAGLNPDYSFTVAAWFSISGLGVDGRNSIVDRYRAGAVNDRKGYKIEVVGTSALYFAGIVGDGTANSVNVGSQILSPMSLNEWYYGVLTHSYAETNGSIKIYLNGELKDTKSLNGYTKFPGTNGLKLGTYVYWPSPSNYIFKGSIDDVRIYNAAISTSQIKEQYYAGLNSLLSSDQINIKEYSERINLIAKQ